MSSLKPTGPLPDSVYWRRRALVLALALLVVVGLGRLFTGGSDAADAPAAASDSGSLMSTMEQAVPSLTAAPSTSAPAAQKSQSPKKNAKAAKKKGNKKTEPPVPTATVEPEGECSPSDVVVEPRVADQPAGRDIKVRLLVSTQETPACLWTASAETLTLKITSGSDDIWFSDQCPKTMPSQSLVLTNEKRTRVTMAWDARRSDEGCTRQRLWALPGTYHLEAAALGGEPTDVRFMLDTPTAKTVAPKPEAKKKSSKKSNKKAGATAKKSEKKKSDG